MLENVIDYARRIYEYGPGRVAVELLLIGLVLDVVLRFLQGTRGLRLMRGLILTVAGAYLLLDVLATRLQLDRIAVLFKPLVFVVLFASLVAFQPELRRALMRLGEVRWLRRFIRESERMIDPLVAAVKYFAACKIGAVIAIERHVGLGSIVENGVQIDAAVSSELLRTLFWPGSALHDLGVVIQEGRIAAAACQFPLTESDQLDPSLGSRHRAAVGLTEDSDALVIVVSEETGNISLAVAGKLYRGLTPEALSREMKDLLPVRREKSKP